MVWQELYIYIPWYLNMSRLGQVALGRLARVVEQALEAQGLRGRHVLGLDLWAVHGKIHGKIHEK